MSPALLDDTTAVIRLGVAFGLGAALGLERELRGQAAGLRTHLLVCLGSCLFTLASVYASLVTEAYVTDLATPLRTDLSRIASQIVVGIGFLGGGAILHHGTSVRGLTTAANLWLTSSVGLAVGLGFHSAAALTVVLALVVLAMLRPIERFIARVRKGFRVDRDDDEENAPGGQG